MVFRPIKYLGLRDAHFLLGRIFAEDLRMNLFARNCGICSIAIFFSLISCISATSIESNAGIAVLNDPLRSRLPTDEEMATDPLLDVADEIRRHIDPSLGEKWPDNLKPEYVEHIIRIHDAYQEFWERIPRESRRYVDLNNNGNEEYVVFSEGLNDQYWGFYNFFAVLGKPLHDYENAGKWGVLHLQIITDHIECFQSKPSKWIEFSLAFSDLDRDGRTDILFTRIKMGASASSRQLNVISIHPDMEIRHHDFWSAAPIEVLKPEALRPVFVKHHTDNWVSGDVGAAVRGRGYRKAYYTWNVCDGFVRQ